jgi:hypothetical protein
MIRLAVDMCVRAACDSSSLTKAKGIVVLNYREIANSITEMKIVKIKFRPPKTTGRFLNQSGGRSLISQRKLKKEEQASPTKACSSLPTLE